MQLTSRPGQGLVHLCVFVVVHLYPAAKRQRLGDAARLTVHTRPMAYVVPPSEPLTDGLATLRLPSGKAG